MRSRPVPVIFPWLKWRTSSIQFLPGRRLSMKKPVHFPLGKRESGSRGAAVGVMDPPRVENHSAVETHLKEERRTDLLPGFGEC